MEHRRGAIKRYKPRFNPEVNDYWMCDYGRASFERYAELPRLSGSLARRGTPLATARAGLGGAGPRRAGLCIGTALGRRTRGARGLRCCTAAL